MTPNAVALNVAARPAGAYRVPGQRFIAVGSFRCWPAEIWDIKSPFDLAQHIGPMLGSRRLLSLVRESFTEPQNYGFPEVTVGNVTPFLNKIISEATSEGGDVAKVDRLLREPATLLARIIKGFSEGNLEKADLPSAFPWLPGEKDRFRDNRSYVLGGGTYSGPTGERFINLVQDNLRQEGLAGFNISLSRWGKSIGVIGAAHLAGQAWPEAKDSWVVTMDLGGTSFKIGAVRIGADGLFAGQNIPREELVADQIEDDFLKEVWRYQRKELATIGWQYWPDWLVKDWWSDKYSDPERLALRGRLSDYISERIIKMIDSAREKSEKVFKGVILTAPAKFDFVGDRYMVVGNCVFPMWGQGANYVPLPFDLEDAIEKRLAAGKYFFRVNAVNDCLACGLADPQPQKYVYLGVGYGLGGAVFEK